MAEMQRAVTLAEKRALDSVTTERIRMERLLLEAASVSGVTGAMNVVSSRKPEMNILDAAMNSDTLAKNEKMISERIKQDTEENNSAFQGSSDWELLLRLLPLDFKVHYPHSVT